MLDGPLWKYYIFPQARETLKTRYQKTDFCLLLWHPANFLITKKIFKSSCCPGEIMSLCLPAKQTELYHFRC